MANNTTLSFTLSPEAVVRLHDIVLCLAKFSESVSIEARRNRLSLTALNSSKSGYASFSLDTQVFFSKYHFTSSRSNQNQSKGLDGRFTCQLYNKALLSVFKGRLLEARERDAAIERCEVNIEERADKTECRLVVKMVCRHGVIKTYKLTYESVEVMHALFDKTAANNTWSIPANVLRDFVEYFGPKTEQLDIYSENGRATFTSYTERIMEGKETLKQPLQTSIAIDTADFEDFAVEDKLHIGISVKDFRAIVTHASTLKASIKASYSHPTRPIQLTYDCGGILCEFTLQTIGDCRGGSTTPRPTVSRGASMRTSQPQLAPAPLRNSGGPTNSTAQPASKPLSRSFIRDYDRQRPTRPSPPPPKPSIDPESLFLPHDDDDRQWDEKNYEHADEDMLGWDASADNDEFAASQNRTIKDHSFPSRHVGVNNVDEDNDPRIAPTQRISQVRGLFDD